MTITQNSRRVGSSQPVFSRGAFNCSGSRPSVFDSQASFSSNAPKNFQPRATAHEVPTSNPLIY